MLRGSGYIAANNLMRDALDLQHRHPALWAALGTGEGRVWKARKVACLVRTAGLSREQAHALDAATTPYIDSLPWGGFLRLVEVKIIEADPAAAEQRRLAAELERFVATGQSDEHGLKTLIARAQAGEVIFFVAMCDRIAQILLLEGDTSPVGVRRSRAVGILANPFRARELLLRYAGPEENEADQREIDLEKVRPRAVLHVTVSEAALHAGTGPAQCGNGIGVTTVEQVREFLGHCQVSVRPVLDPHAVRPVDGRQVPALMREALEHCRPSSIYPWSSFESRDGTTHVDLDHTDAYVPLEAARRPGQTRLDNLGPMIRFGHRVKTHGRGWRHRQPVPGVYLWRTPHGYWFRVDRTGTHALGRDPVAVTPGSALERHFADLVLAA